MRSSCRPFSSVVTSTMGTPIWQRWQDVELRGCLSLERKSHAYSFWRSHLSPGNCFRCSVLYGAFSWGSVRAVPCLSRFGFGQGQAAAQKPQKDRRPLYLDCRSDADYFFRVLAALCSADSLALSAALRVAAFSCGTLERSAPP